MRYVPGLPGRRSIRLPGYDYTQPGAYFITICTHKRERLFGEVVDGTMCTTPYGDVVRDEWLCSGINRPGVLFHTFVVMPDHFHGIIIIDVDRAGSGDRRGTAQCRGTARRAPKASVATRDVDNARRSPAFGQPIAGSIPTIVGAFKSAVTKRINVVRGTPGAPVWQRNYYESILPDLQALRPVETYIRSNPARG